MNLFDIVCTIGKVKKICEEFLAIRLFIYSFYFGTGGGEGVKNILEDLDGCVVEQDF